MDSITKYREIVQTVLQQYVDRGGSRGAVERQLVFDTKNNHYQIVDVGWQSGRRIYGCALHLDIKDGKIWIQHNGTEVEIGEELIKMGVPKGDIVVGFHSPARRKLTDFAAN